MLTKSMGGRMRINEKPCAGQSHRIPTPLSASRRREGARASWALNEHGTICPATDAWLKWNQPHHQRQGTSPHLTGMALRRC